MIRSLFEKTARIDRRIGYPFVLLLFSIIPFVSMAQQGWFWQNRLPQGNTLYAVYPLDRDRAYAVGTTGSVLSTTDRGAHWSVLPYAGETQATLRAISVISPSIILAAGDSGTVLNTTDGGVKWTRRFLSGKRAVNAMVFPSNSVGFIAADNGTIFRTTNGGTSWNEQASTTTKKLRALYFISPNIGWAVGDSGIVRSTFDGGLSWNSVPSGTGRNLYSVYFKNIDTGWIAGDNGTLRVTTDGGANWLPLVSGTPERISKVNVTSPSRSYGIAGVGSATLIQSFNGGFNWSRSTKIDSVNTLYDVSFSDSLSGWAVGSNGEIKVTGNSGATWASLSRGNVEALFASSFPDVNHGWCVGQGGIILSTSNSGSTWTSQVSGTTNFLYDIRFNDPANGWVVGDAGTILQTADGGTTWNTRARSLILSPLSTLWFVDNTYGWAAGSRGVVLKTTDGGLNWSRVSTLDTFVSFTSITFANRDTGLATADSIGIGRIYKTTDGGAAWSSQLADSQYSPGLQAVFTRPSGDAWVTGQSGYIWKSTDFGDTWIRQSSPLRSSGNSIYFSSNTTGWISSATGTIIKTTNGGVKWFFLRSGTSNSLNTIQFIDDSTGWAVGSSGTIIKTVDGGGQSPKPVTPPPPSVGKDANVGQNVPNPFIPSRNADTFIPFRLDGTSQVTVKVYNSVGMEVRRIEAGIFVGGIHDWTNGGPSWDGKDNNGFNAPSGVYFYRVFTSEYIEARRMILLR